MKTCSKCEIEKSLDNFFIRDKKSGRLHSQCKDCYRLLRQSTYKSHYEKYKNLYRNRARERRLKLKIEFRTNMLDYLSDKSCEDCAESDIRTFEFDHIDPSNKKFSVSQAVKLGYGWSEVQNEIKKCRILCANCHKKRTALQYGWYKN